MFYLLPVILWQKQESGTRTHKNTRIPPSGRRNYTPPPVMQAAKAAGSTRGAQAISGLLVREGKHHVNNEHSVQPSGTSCWLHALPIILIPCPSSLHAFSRPFLLLFFICSCLSHPVHFFFFISKRAHDPEPHQSSLVPDLSDPHAMMVKPLSDLLYTGAPNNILLHLLCRNCEGLTRQGVTSLVGAVKLSSHVGYYCHGELNTVEI